jgi:hypothetical protein
VQNQLAPVISFVALCAANPNISIAKPLKNNLIPMRIPIAQAPESGNWLQIKMPSKNLCEIRNESNVGIVTMSLVTRFSDQ